MASRHHHYHDKDDWFVYVLRNKHSGDVYTGCTNDPRHRFGL